MSLNDKFYMAIAGGTVNPVKKALKTINKRGANLEITNLVISGLNDNEADFVKMI